MGGIDKKRSLVEGDRGACVKVSHSETACQMESHALPASGHIVGLLVTEAFRGWGAHMVNSDGKRFINELEKLDITAPAIIREVVRKKKGIFTPTGREGVWLDTPLVEMINGRGTINRIFPHLKHRFQGFGIDITK